MDSFLRTISDLQDLLKPLEEAIHSVVILVLLNRSISNFTCSLGKSFERGNDLPMLISGYVSQIQNRTSPLLQRRFMLSKETRKKKHGNMLKGSHRQNNGHLRVWFLPPQEAWSKNAKDFTIYWQSLLN